MENDDRVKRLKTLENLCPRISDNDGGEITATLEGKEIRGWSYANAAEQSLKMQCAHEFAEGWFQALGRKLNASCWRRK